MKLGVLSLVLVAGSVGGALAYALQGPVPVPSAEDSLFHQIATAEDVIAISLGGNESIQQIALIDTEQRVLSVYGIDRTNGAITLQNVRKVEWDLQLDEFNGTEPLPIRIKEMVERN